MLLQSIGRSDSPLKLRLKTLPHVAGWGAGLLRSAAPELYERNTSENLKFALHSLDLMRRLCQGVLIQNGDASPGTLRIVLDPALLGRALDWAERLRADGLTYRPLTGREIVAIEPAREPVGGQVAGCLHYPVDEIRYAPGKHNGDAQWRQTVPPLTLYRDCRQS